MPLSGDDLAVVDDLVEDLGVACARCKVIIFMGAPLLAYVQNIVQEMSVCLSRMACARTVTPCDGRCLSRLDARVKSLRPLADCGDGGGHLTATRAACPRRTRTHVTWNRRRVTPALAAASASGVQSFAPGRVDLVPVHDDGDPVVSRLCELPRFGSAASPAGDI